MQIIKNSNIDFLNNSRFTILLSGALILAGIFSLIINNGPKLSIDFKGGTLITVQYTTSININDLRARLINVNISGQSFDFSNSEIKHFGSYTSKLDDTGNIEYLRNWHWMWSKFYFNKKHYGYLRALLKTFSNLISAIFKYLYYSLLFNKHKKNIYKMRFLGLVNSIVGKKSYLRPKN